jgi:hypothetical protein
MSGSRGPQRDRRRGKKAPVPSSAFLAALAKRVGVRIADRKLSELKEEDWGKLEALQAAWKADGDIAFKRMWESDFIGYARVVAALNPRAMREALEAEILERGMTNREFLASCLEKARQIH